MPAVCQLDPRISEEQAEKEKRLECLERCLEELSADDHDLIMRFYLGEERVKIDNRRALAAERGISVETLRGIAYRIRSRLRDRVTKRLYE